MFTFLHSLNLSCFKIKICWKGSHKALRPVISSVNKDFSHAQKVLKHKIRKKTLLGFQTRVVAKVQGKESKQNL